MSIHINIVKWVLPVYLGLCFFSCGEESVSPKIRMYPKVNYPEKKYTKYENPACPFTFEYPAYGIIKKDSLFFQDKVLSDCWFDLRIDTLLASVHCNYVEISKENTLDKLVNDAFTIAPFSGGPCQRPPAARGGGGDIPPRCTRAGPGGRAPAARAPPGAGAGGGRGGPPDGPRPPPPFTQDRNLTTIQSTNLAEFSFQNHFFNLYLPSKIKKHKLLTNQCV
ncbi:MAG: hypothetical protein IPN49_10085 [Saprospiraceae bacterium]|nr:hypothetical protein [Saprospiraceae bacterium]